MTTTSSSDIELTVNGHARRVSAPCSVAQLLSELAPAGRRIAVERNGSIVPRSAYEQTLVTEGDRLEIVIAVGGG